MPFSWTDLAGSAGTVASLTLLEAVLSADNAVALAGIVSTVEPPDRRRRALSLGLALSFLLRGATVLAAGWVIRIDAVRSVAGLYLVFLAARHFQSQFRDEEEPTNAMRGLPEGLGDAGLIATLALTDLAFSIDSVGASVALTDSLPLVLLGGAMGMAMLRFLAAWVVGWMERFVDLANAAYLTVLAVGLRLLALGSVPDLAPSQPVLLILVVVLLLWGFRRQHPALGLSRQGPPG